VKVEGTHKLCYP